jgi:hypothetical protein
MCVSLAGGRGRWTLSVQNTVGVDGTSCSDDVGHKVCWLPPGVRGTQPGWEHSLFVPLVDADVAGGAYEQHALGRDLGSAQVACIPSEVAGDAGPILGQHGILEITM